MTLTVRLTDHLARLLRERALRGGRGAEEYVLHLIERDASEMSPDDETGIAVGQGPALPDPEFARLLDELSSGPKLPCLPEGFSRADLYADHD